MREFPPEVIEELGSYVYLYIDPRTGLPFYVGKGVGNRAFDHLYAKEDSDKVARIEKIKASGQEPMIEILRHGLTDGQATLVEASVIDLLGLDSLANKCRGIHSQSFGRISASDVLLTYSARPTDIFEPMVLILINRLFRSDMSELELYEATRGIWEIGPRREGARYACTVFNGVIREVYEISEWNPAGTTPYMTRDDSEFHGSGRWEFEAVRAPGGTRSRYMRRSVKHLLNVSAQNPIRYINC